MPADLPTKLRLQSWSGSPQNAEDPDQAALAAPFFRFRHQANRPIPPNPEAKSGKAAGSGAADGGSVTRAS